MLSKLCEPFFKPTSAFLSERSTVLRRTLAPCIAFFAILSR